MIYYTSSWMGNLTSQEIEYYVNEYASDTEVIAINDVVEQYSLRNEGVRPDAHYNEVALAEIRKERQAT
ncbi:hypothetical protein XPA_007438 [Xanthoria parietina]